MIFHSSLMKPTIIFVAAIAVTELSVSAPGADAYLKATVSAAAQKLGRAPRGGQFL
jgi:hypothetical protein